jgi:hypothetical protein
MSDFEQLIENNLTALRAGKAIQVQCHNWNGIVANAAWDAVLEPSLWRELQELQTMASPVLLFADERQLVQYISAYDLTDTEKLEAGEWLEMNGLLGIAEQWLGNGQSAQVSLVQDQHLFALIKRLRAPLVGFRQAVLPDH